jgi:hypothetical protein
MVRDNRRLRKLETSVGYPAYKARKINKETGILKQKHKLDVTLFLLFFRILDFFFLFALIFLRSLIIFSAVARSHSSSTGKKVVLMYRTTVLLSSLRIRSV